MVNIPQKCLTCNHTLMKFENVNKGNCEFQYEEVVRCDCSPMKYPVGCVCADIYCERKEQEE